MKLPHEQAKAWRERMKLTVQELSDRSGYGLTTIYMFERGMRQDGKQLSEHSAFAWERYRLICAAVDKEIRTGRRFAW